LSKGCVIRRADPQVSSAQLEIRGELKSTVNVFIATINSNVAEASTCTIKYFNEASVLYMFLMLDIREINDIRLISRPIHAPNHELEYTDTKRILVELLGIREESVILYLWGMNPLAYLAYFSVLKLVYYVLMFGFWLFHVSKCVSFRAIRIVNNPVY